MTRPSKSTTYFIAFCRQRHRVKPIGWNDIRDISKLSQGSKGATATQQSDRALAPGQRTCYSRPPCRPDLPEHPAERRRSGYKRHITTDFTERGNMPVE